MPLASLLWFRAVRTRYVWSASVRVTEWLVNRNWSASSCGYLGRWVPGSRFSGSECLFGPCLSG